MPVVYTAMASTVKPATEVVIDDRVARLRLQLVASEMGLRIGQRIRARRQEVGYATQKQLADAIKKILPAHAVDAQRVSDWERGVNRPSEDYFRALVTVLRVPSVGYFFESDEEVAEPDSTPGPFPARMDFSERLDRLERYANENAETVNQIWETLELIRQMLERSVAADVKKAATRKPPPASGPARATHQ